MSKPLLTGDQVRGYREFLGKTQDELAKLLGFHGPLRRQRVSKIETGLDQIDYVRANLLIAMTLGYKPVGFEDDQPKDQPVTQRQLEALWVARETGNAVNLAMSRKGGARRIFYILRSKGLLNADFSISKDGLEVLALHEATMKKPMSPLHKRKLKQLVGKE